MSIIPEPLGKDHDYDLATLDREMDRVKSKVFLDNNAAFYGPLMCSMNFVWSESIPTAATDGVTIWWNPRWFMEIPFETRKTVLVHELKHVAGLHMLRRSEREPKRWNIACDFQINNDLDRQKYTFEGTQPCLDQNFGEMVPEDIYDLLPPDICAPWGPGGGDPSNSGGLGGDDIIISASPEVQRQMVNNVVQATQSAKLSKQAGSIPGETELYLSKFLKPKIPWETVLYLWFNDLGDADYTFARPNRRYTDMYLPSLVAQDDRLEHLIWYWDVSGSVTDVQALRMASEVKYIKEHFNPAKLTIVQFDTRITAERTFTDDDPFEDVVIIGRGGTDLTPVREHIMEHRPTAAVIFSDLFCNAMEPGPTCPVLWIAVDNRQANVNFGKLIHIKA
jgi:predicted metal-dependent peptidase